MNSPQSVQFQVDSDVNEHFNGGSSKNSLNLIQQSAYMRTKNRFAGSTHNAHKIPFPTWNYTESGLGFEPVTSRLQVLLFSVQSLIGIDVTAIWRLICVNVN